jgi:hypothetical protein
MKGPSTVSMKAAAEKVVAGFGFQINAFLFVGEDRTDPKVMALQIERAKSFLEEALTADFTKA